METVYSVQIHDVWIKVCVYWDSIQIHFKQETNPRKKNHLYLTRDEFKKLCQTVEKESESFVLSSNGVDNLKATPRSDILQLTWEREG